MAKTKDENRVEGVDMDRVDQKVVERFLSEFKIKLKAGATLEEKVSALAVYQKKTPEKHLADCDCCGGDSDVRLSCCPYCGEGDGEDAVSSEVVEASPAPTRQQAAASKKNGGGKKSDKAVVQVPPKEGPPESGKTEKDLDDGVQRVMGLKAAGAVCVWELGQEVARIYDQRLYMLRKTKTGHGKYKNWGQFCQVELGMTSSYSYKLMDVSKLFRKEDFQKVGVTKLAIMIQLPEAERRELLEKAREGLSRSEIAKRVRDSTEGRPPRVTGRGDRARNKDLGKASAAGSKGLREKGAKKANELTVVAQLGRATIPLYQRARKKGEEPRRAKTLAQDPSGTEQLVNGMVIHYRVVKQSKGLAIVVERRRGEPGK